MIYVTNAIAVNEAGQPKLTRADVWAGLELKANNALPFVPAMTQCEVLERRGELEFDQSVELKPGTYSAFFLAQKHAEFYGRLRGQGRSLKRTLVVGGGS